MNNFIKHTIFLIIGAVIIAFAIFSVPMHNVQKSYTELKQEEVIPEPVFKYDIPVDSFLIFEERIKRNQNLSEILRPYNITPAQIDKITKYRDTFDVRRIRSGNHYTIFCNKDTTARYFIYEETPVDYIVIDFGDSVTMYTGHKEITQVRRIASGFIETNLWNAMLEYDIDPMMSIELSEIYAWSIDFFGLKKGDHFSVIYEEQYVDTTRIGIGKIYSALFNHRNKDFYAISFEQDSIENYFDSAGQSLHRTFLKAPLRFSRISSRFSYSRLHPILKIRRPHTGIDYAAPYGTPVHTVGDGVVITKKYTRQGGRVVKIKHNSVYTTGYLHLSRYGKGVKVGAHVKQGQTIGYVGTSGLATGPHLDFRFWKNGQPVDPLKVESKPVEPIKKVNLEEYERIRDEMIKELKKADVKLHEKHPVLSAIIQKKRLQDREVMALIARVELSERNKKYAETYMIPGNENWKLK